MRSTYADVMIVPMAPGSQWIAKKTARNRAATPPVSHKAGAPPLKKTQRTGNNRAGGALGQTTPACHHRWFLLIIEGRRYARGPSQTETPGGICFLIGTGPLDLSGLSGELTVGYWDSYYPDNSGTQTLSVSAVPEPSTWA